MSEAGKLAGETRFQVEVMSASIGRTMYELIKAVEMHKLATKGESTLDARALAIGMIDKAIADWGGE